MKRSYNRSVKRTIGPEETVAIRLAVPADEQALRRLAALDSSQMLRGPVVVADVSGELRAARSLADGRTIGDPFRWTAELLALLELRARQLEVPAPTPLRPGPGRAAPQRPRAA
jgi:hypothetical protein